jgi:hypothetical protein
MRLTEIIPIGHGSTGRVVTGGDTANTDVVSVLFLCSGLFILVSSDVSGFSFGAKIVHK